MTRCNQCDWQPVHDGSADGNDRERLRQHALDSGHGLCCVCARSLTEHEPQTCQQCVGNAGSGLTTIGALYAELPDHLGHVRSPAYDSDRPGASDGRPLLGGDVLVLLGRGSEGLAEDGTTSKDGDPVSVAFELGWWVQDWRETRNDPDSSPPRSVRAEVQAHLRYLQAGLQWAANSHPAFGEFARDVDQLHARLERATGHDQPTVRAEAECFECGADALIRKVTASGYDDRWTCRRCGAQYDWQRYLQACRMRVETGRQQLREAGGWGTPVHVAAATGTHVETVRTWAKRGLVSSACDLATKALQVWYPDAEDRAERRRKRTAA